MVFALYELGHNLLSQSYLEEITRRQDSPHYGEIDIWQKRGTILAHGRLAKWKMGAFEIQNQGSHTFGITAMVRLDNRQALQKQLFSTLLQDVFVSDSAIILEAYKKWGARCVNHLQGNYSFVIWDGLNRSLFCVRDRIGIYPLYYYWHENRFVCAHDISLILQCSALQLTSNPYWVADHLCDIWLETEDTFYQEIRRLPPAHTLTVTPEGVRLARYWDFDPKQETILSSDEAYRDRGYELLTQAVRRCVQSNNEIGLELSGGLDSTAVAALAKAEQRATPSMRLSTYSHTAPIGLAGKQGFGSDERENIELVARFLGLDTNCFFSNESKTTLPMKARALQIGNGIGCSTYAVLTSEIQRMAAERGVEVMLSGWGGDQLVSSRIKTDRFLLHERSWALLWGELGGDGRLANLRKLRRLARLIRQTHNPLGLQPPHNNAQQERRQRTVAQIEHLLQIFPQLQDYIADVDWFGRLNEWWGLYEFRPQPLRERQYTWITDPHIVSRLESTALMAGTFGIEYRYPLLDVELLTFFLSVPASQKQRHGQQRFLFRQCIEGLIPEEIRTAQKARGTVYPWFFPSLVNDLDQAFPEVAADASEATQVSWLIAHAKHMEQRERIDQYKALL